MLNINKKGKNFKNTNGSSSSVISQYLVFIIIMLVFKIVLWKLRS